MFCVCAPGVLSLVAGDNTPNALASKLHHSSPAPPSPSVHAVSTNNMSSRPLHLGHQKPSAFLVASTKLQNEWSANRCIGHITPEWLDELLGDAQFSSINSMAKIRLLLAGLLALDQVAAAASRQSTPAQQQQTASQHAELRQALQRLRDAVAADSDEWDKVMAAAAAGPMDGRLDLEAVMKQSPAVQESMTKLKQQVAASSSNQHLMPPLEDDFLRNPPSLLDPDAGHFVVRQNPRVQHLSEGFSYTQATPPPPSLLRATGLQPSSAHAGAAGAAAAAGHPRPGARTQQGGSSGLARAKSGHLERQHTVQLLDDEEQANLFKNTHQKHGVASAVRHEQLVYEKPEKPPGTSNQQQPQQRQRQPPQQPQQPELPKGRRFNIYGASAARPSPEALAAARAAAGGGGGGGGAGGQQQQQQQRQQQQPRAVLRDADIDDLFDDDGFIDDREIQQPAPTGVSISGRHFLQRKYAAAAGDAGAGGGEDGTQEGERDATPDELMDDLEGDGDGGAAGVAVAAAGGSGGGEQQQGEDGGGGDDDMQQDEAAAAPAPGRGGFEREPQAAVGGGKRRRVHVIASDSDDDD